MNVRRLPLARWALLVAAAAVAGLVGSGIASADPARTVTGTVTADPFANLRDGAEGSVIGQATHGTTYTVVCYTEGPNQVSGTGDTNPYWDKVTAADGRDAGWIADVWLDTGNTITTQVDPCREGDTAGARAARIQNSQQPKGIDAVVMQSPDIEVYDQPDQLAGAVVSHVPHGQTVRVTCYHRGLEPMQGWGGDADPWWLRVTYDNAWGWIPNVWVDTHGDVTALGLPLCGEGQPQEATGPADRVPDQIGDGRACIFYHESRQIRQLPQLNHGHIAYAFLATNSHEWVLGSATAATTS